MIRKCGPHACRHYNEHSARCLFRLFFRRALLSQEWKLGMAQSHFQAHSAETLVPPWSMGKAAIYDISLLCICSTHASLMAISSASGELEVGVGRNY